MKIIFTDSGSNLMKHILLNSFSAVALCALCGCTFSQKIVKCDNGAEKSVEMNINVGMKNTMENESSPLLKTYRFIKNAEHYYIATVEGDQPRVRPFGTIHVFENRLYIQTGRSKNVAKQLVANGKVEICALKDGQWIRVSGTLVDDNRREAKASMLSEYESLRKIGYSENDENTMVLYFKPGTVTSTIYSFTDKPVVMNF